MQILGNHNFLLRHMFQIIGEMYSDEYSVLLGFSRLSNHADGLFVTNRNKLARICYIHVAIV